MGALLERAARAGAARLSREDSSGMCICAITGLLSHPRQQCLIDAPSPGTYSVYALARILQFHGRANRTVGVVIDIVASQSAGTGAAIVGNGYLFTVVFGDDAQVEID